MEKEVTDELIMKYLEQLNHLRKVLFKDKYSLVLIKLQYALGNYIRAHKKEAHHYAFKIFRSNLISMDKILSAKNMTAMNKKDIIDKEIRLYNKLRRIIKTNKSNSMVINE